MPQNTSGVEIRVVGLKSLMRNSRLIGDGLDKAFRKVLRNQLTPVVAEARVRFRAMGGTGPQTARTVRGFVRANAVGFQMGGKGGEGSGFELGDEFGAKDRARRSTFMRTAGGKSTNAGRTFEVTRFENYSQPTLFGPWTGNQFRPELRVAGAVSGHAFYPSIAESYDRIVDGLTTAIDQGLEALKKEGE